jgi:hypothetical protein
MPIELPIFTGRYISSKLQVDFGDTEKEDSPDKPSPWIITSKFIIWDSGLYNWMSTITGFRITVYIWIVF